MGEIIDIKPLKDKILNEIKNLILHPNAAIFDLIKVEKYNVVLLMPIIQSVEKEIKE